MLILMEYRIPDFFGLVFMIAGWVAMVQVTLTFCASKKKKKTAAGGKMSRSTSPVGPSVINADQTEEQRAFNEKMKKCEMEVQAALKKIAEDKEIENKKEEKEKEEKKKEEEKKKKEEEEKKAKTKEEASKEKASKEKASKEKASKEEASKEETKDEEDKEEKKKKKKKADKSNTPEKKPLSPKHHEYNDKEKAIAAGQKKAKTDYPTMEDVDSDWDDNNGKNENKKKSEKKKKKKEKEEEKKDDLWEAEKKELSKSPA